MEKDKFIIITFPEIQNFMCEEGFVSNSCLVTDNMLRQEYGNSAYFVREIWLDNLYKNTNPN